MRALRVAAGALVALAVAGCGTTVSGTVAVNDVASPGATSGDALSVPSAGAALGGPTVGTSGSRVADATGTSGQPLIPGHTGSVGSTGAGGIGAGAGGAGA